MTPEILQWLALQAQTHLSAPGRVLEVGSQNINGSPRSVLQKLATEYIGTDMQAGEGVDIVCNNTALYDSLSPNTLFDTVVCCECLEHDVMFWDTVSQMRLMLKFGGLLVITTPALGFPYHAYPRHYVNFTKDAYEDIFFEGMDILDLTHLHSAAGEKTTLAGIARKR